VSTGGKPEAKKHNKISPIKKTKHHMVPLSRIKREDHAGRPNFTRDNLKHIRWRLHEAWHSVFDTLTPFEAVLLIIRELSPPGYFIEAEIQVSWGRYEHEFKLADIDNVTIPPRKKSKQREEALKLLFANRDWVNAISHVVYDWSPTDYFRFVHIVGKNDQGENTFTFNRTTAPNE